VVLDLTRSTGSDRGIVAWKKLSTTKNPSEGINNVIKDMFEQSNINPQDVASVTIGTTHFINAVVEMDRSRLAKVAVIRLCGPFQGHPHWH
jgi:N-methylhydantoinase A/oxoprolinase/acetone carboxylase beta subunit